MNSNQEQVETFISEVARLLESNGFILEWDSFVIGVDLAIALKWPDNNDLRIKEIHNLLKNNGYRNFIISTYWAYRDTSKRKGIEVGFCPTKAPLSPKHIPIPDFIS